MGVRSVGVEEELLLVEPGTRPCTTLDELEGELRRARAAAAEAAGRVGVQVAALGTSLVPVEPESVGQPRYQRMTEAFGLTAQEQLTYGCHVHVQVGSDEEGVAVLDRIQPWLASLLALSANSPFWQGADSSYASFRYQAWGRWPCSGPTEWFGSAQAYQATVDQMVRTGTLLDTGMVYDPCRLGPRLAGRPKAVKSADDGPRVLVVGAGFAGLSTMSRLARGGFRVTLADRHIYSTFQPLLYQVATAGLAPSDVAYPLRGFAHKYGARFRHGDLASLDTGTRVAEFTDGGRIEYDYLILATGVTAGFYGITGAAEHSHALYTLHDAVTMRERILAGLEQLSLDGARDVTVTIVGGGATGVELAGTLAELRNIGLPASYPDIHPRCVHIRLVEMAPYLLGPYVPPLREYARRQLVNRGVDLHLDAKIREITGSRIILDSGEEIPSDLTAWAAGVAGPPVVGKWGLPQGKGGRLLVGPDLRVEGQERIFATGDIALTGDDPLPQLAQPAIQMGRHAAEQIRRLEAGQATVPFRYHDKGTMATIGSRSAVVQLNHGIRFRGTIAWLAWLALHLVTLLGGRNRISALINLSYRYLSWRRGGGIIVGDDPPAVNAEGN